MFVVCGELYEAVQIPVHADAAFAGLLGGGCRVGELWKSVVVDTDLAVADDQFNGADMTQASSGLERIARSNTVVTIFFSCEHEGAGYFPGAIVQLTSSTFVKELLRGDDVLAHDSEWPGVVIGLGRN